MGNATCAGLLCDFGELVNLQYTQEPLFYNLFLYEVAVLRPLPVTFEAIRMEIVRIISRASTNTRTLLTILFLIGLSLRICILFTFWKGNESVKYVEDVKIAINLFEHKGFSYNISVYKIGLPPEPRSTAMKGPIYPLIVFLLFKIFGFKNFLVIYLFNILLSSMTLCLIFLSLDRIHRLFALMSSLCFAIYPPFVFHSSASVIESTSLVLFFISLFLYVVTISVRLDGNKSIYLASPIAALIVLTEPIIFPSCLILFILSCIYISKRFYVVVSKSIIFLLVSFLICIPWIIRNHIVLGDATIKSVLGYNLYLGLIINNKIPDTFHRDVMERLRDMRERNASELEEDRYLSKTVFAFYRENPSALMKTFSHNLFGFWWITDRYRQNLSMSFILFRQAPRVIIMILTILSLSLFLADRVRNLIQIKDLDFAFFYLLILSLSCSFIYGFTVAFNLRFFFPVEMMMIYIVPYIFLRRTLLNKPTTEI